MRLKKLWLAVAGGGILLVGLIAGALIGGGLPAWAAGALSGQAFASRAPAAQGGYCQVYVQALASQLHVSESTLATANQAALKATIQQAYKDGKITQAEETRLLNQVDNASAHPCAFVRLGRGLAGGPGAARPQLRAAHTAIVAAVASKLGITPATLQSDLRAGQTVPQLAQQRHVALDGTNGLNAAYLAAVQQQLNQAVSKGLITQTQSTRLYQMAQQGVQSGHYLLLDAGPGRHGAHPGGKHQQPATPSAQQ